MHTHISAIALLCSFTGVLILGTLWRLLAAHFVVSNSDNLATLGKVMAFQY
ncbi:MAG: hypothetical protein JSR64_17075 [Nitrospira sp.]|nr:hypothetical protein [Nitrospira sp.]